jgi:RNA polymerase sigma-70 factor, ECF subfamily
MLPSMYQPLSLASPTARAEDDAMPETLDFEAFYERERDRLFGALVLMTGNRFEAEEIAQDAFLAMWERWGRMQNLDDPTGYLYRTAMNVFRKRRRRAAMALRRTGRASSEAGDAFADAERRTVVAAALATLSRRQRAALVLTSLLQYTSEEAGRMLSVRPATVRVLAAQGRAALKARMERSDE